MTLFLDFFASGVVLLLLQMHVKSEFESSAYNVGIVFTSYSAASIVGSFVLGRMSDSIGRRPIIIVSLLMSTVTLYMTAVASTLERHDGRMTFRHLALLLPPPPPPCCGEIDVA